MLFYCLRIRATWCKEFLIFRSYFYAFEYSCSNWTTLVMSRAQANWSLLVWTHLWNLCWPAKWKFYKKTGIWIIFDAIFWFIFFFVTCEWKLGNSLGGLCTSTAQIFNIRPRGTLTAGDSWCLTLTLFMLVFFCREPCCLSLPTFNNSTGVALQAHSSWNG